MLHSIAMRSGLLLPIALVIAAGAACSDEKPTFGNAGGALGRRLPGEVGGAATSNGANGPFPNAYNADENRPTTTLTAGHTGKGAAPANGTDVTASSQCLDCHKAGGVAAGKPWSFGGRVLNKGKTAGEANADVIVVNADGKVVGNVKTDAEGFFWAAPGANALADGASTSVRNGPALTNIATMGTKLNPANGGQNDGGCDRAGGNCHKGTTGSIVAK